ncbi:hypothetical protein PISMIDRAFT_19771 [Pisolithus microcarpus 441]|uniref:Uncharacterized protein n=1 Tax=Pisolithus microcarpus 441 TaxID=765257 RepID=A0A0C9YTD0_9AGAM|nr:hypothetical protein PISMIDRAFT_19771 [Pisolithus microcarpus 441]
MAKAQPSASGPFNGIAMTDVSLRSKCPLDNELGAHNLLRRGFHGCIRLIFQHLDRRERREDRRRGRGPFATNTREHPYERRPGDRRSTHARSQPESSKAAGKRPAAPPPLRIHSDPPSTASPNQPVAGPSRIATDDTLSTTIVTTNDDEDGVYEEYYEEELADESMNTEVPTVDEGAA